MTLFRLPEARPCAPATLTCVWISTTDRRNPLRCVWVSAPASSTSIAQEASTEGGVLCA